METIKPVIVEIQLNAPVSKVWTAITKPEEIKQWFMAAPELKPEIGNEFHMMGHKGGKDYPITCIIKEIEPNKKISFSWQHDEFPNVTLVTIELTPDNNKTNLKLVHSGWTENHPEKVSREGHQGGWNYFIGENLKNYVEGN